MSDERRPRSRFDTDEADRPVRSRFDTDHRSRSPARRESESESHRERSPVPREGTDSPNSKAAAVKASVMPERGFVRLKQKRYITALLTNGTAHT